MRQGCLYRFVVFGVVFVNDGDNFGGGGVYVHSVVVVGKANRPVIEAFCGAFTQDGAHELFADVFSFEAGTQARAQTVAAFAILFADAVRCGRFGGYRLCGGCIGGSRSSGDRRTGLWRAR